MTDFVLVIGSIKSAQYRPASLALLEKGLKPQVFRIGEQAAVEPSNDQDDSDIPEFLKQMLGVDPLEIRAIVMPERLVGHPGFLPDLYPDYFHTELVVWVVHDTWTEYCG